MFQCLKAAMRCSKSDPIIWTLKCVRRDIDIHIVSAWLLSSDLWKESCGVESQPRAVWGYIYPPLTFTCVSCISDVYITVTHTVHPDLLLAHYSKYLRKTKSAISQPSTHQSLYSEMCIIIKKTFAGRHFFFSLRFEKGMILCRLSAAIQQSQSKCSVGLRQSVYKLKAPSSEST